MDPSRSLPQSTSLPALRVPNYDKKPRASTQWMREGPLARVERIEAQFEAKVPLSTHVRQQLLVSLTSSRETQARRNRLPPAALARAEARRVDVPNSEIMQLEMFLTDACGGGGSSSDDHAASAWTGDGRAVALACLKALERCSELLPHSFRPLVRRIGTQLDARLFSGEHCDGDGQRLLWEEVVRDVMSRQLEQARLSGDVASWDLKKAQEALARASDQVARLQAEVKEAAEAQRRAKEEVYQMNSRLTASEAEARELAALNAKLTTDAEGAVEARIAQLSTQIAMLTEELENTRASEETLHAMLERAVPLDEHAAVLRTQRDSLQKVGRAASTPPPPPHAAMDAAAAAARLHPRGVLLSACVMLQVAELEGVVDAQKEAIGELERELGKELTLKAACQARLHLATTATTLHLHHLHPRHHRHHLSTSTTSTLATPPPPPPCTSTSLQAELSGVRQSYTPRPGWDTLIHTAERDAAMAHHAAAQRGVGAPPADTDEAAGHPSMRAVNAHKSSAANVATIYGVYASTRDEARASPQPVPSSPPMPRHGALDPCPGPQLCSRPAAASPSPPRPQLLELRALLPSEEPYFVGLGEGDGVPCYLAWAQVPGLPARASFSCSLRLFPSPSRACSCSCSPSPTHPLSTGAGRAAAQLPAAQAGHRGCDQGVLEVLLRPIEPIPLVSQPCI